MKALKILLVVVGSFILAVLGGVITGSAYQHLRYPGVEDTDGLLDIGAAVFVGFAAVVVGIGAFFVIRYFRRRRA